MTDISALRAHLRDLTVHCLQSSLYVTVTQTFCHYLLTRFPVDLSALEFHPPSSTHFKLGSRGEEIFVNLRENEQSVVVFFIPNDGGCSRKVTCKAKVQINLAML